ncbi:MAG: isoprenylcysteine carboxylmethyltransferase family protein [Candidatus Methylarchaceae archaeon HK02M2]|nr:isoprenylcysteine carboxylmethyltransferase family protein [Candidatus Methylarchaceae archaeon HK02M2]
MSRKSFFTIDYLPATLASILFISQIIVGLYLLSADQVTQIGILAYFGVGLYTFSGLFFGLLPVIEFRKKGKVENGKSYINTTRLVDTGIYSIVRHPQYVTFILWAIAGMLLFQHLIVVLLGIPIIPLIYIDLIKADKEAIEKFGNDYKIYMKKVPRANFILGIMRRFMKNE